MSAVTVSAPATLIVELKVLPGVLMTWLSVWPAGTAAMP